MLVKILAIGDIFGKPGRSVVKENLLKLKREYSVDFVVANVENATGGKGISKKHYFDLKNDGIDVMTSGNHIFHLKETEDYINDKDIFLLRPGNFGPYYPGKGSLIFSLRGLKIRITNLIGRELMQCNVDNPYFYFDKILNDEIDSNNRSDIHLVDFHAESSGEKNIFAYHYRKTLTALWGTHTHVQTNDERIIESDDDALSGTAFITDIGMTGSYDGIIGADPASIIRKSKYGLPGKIIPHYDCKKKQINGVIFSIDCENKKVVKIEKIKKIY